VGGGTVTGPRPRSYDQRTPARVKAEAVRTALAARVASGEVVVLEAVELAEPKTRLFQELLDAVGLSGDLLLVVPEYDRLVHRSGRNIKGLDITTAAEVTAHDLLAPKTVILTRAAIARLEARLA
jgi:large subunit ribosomal protein L4